MKNRYIKVPSIVEKNKLHFSLKYFNFSNSSSLKFKNYKKFFNKLQQCHNQNTDELINNNQIILKKSQDTIKLAQSIIKSVNCKCKCNKSIN